EGIADEKQCSVVGKTIRPASHHCRSSAPGERVRDKGVAVERRSLQGYEQIARDQSPGIDGDAVRLPGAFGPTVRHPGGFLTGPQGRHFAHRSRSRTTARTTSASSKGSTCVPTICP